MKHCVSSGIIPQSYWLLGTSHLDYIWQWVHYFVAVFCWGYCIFYFLVLISVGFYVYVCVLMGLALSEEILSLCRFFQSGIKQQSLLHRTLTTVCYKWSPLWCNFNWTIMWVVLWLVFYRKVSKSEPELISNTLYCVCN